MSWSVTLIGQPENLAKALDEYSSQLNGTSKEEYDECKAHLIALVNLNYNEAYPPVMKITASGHGYSTTLPDGKVSKYNSCTVNIEHLGATLV